MPKKINYQEKIFVAGGNGMAGSAICRMLRNAGYGDKGRGGELLIPSRKELNLLNINEVQSWFENNKPTVVILAAAKVGGILANSNFPLDFLLNNIKIQTKVIETSWRNIMSSFHSLIFIVLQHKDVSLDASAVNS